MNTFEKILMQLSGKMETPGNYGWFHLMFCGIVIVATILLCYFLKDCKVKTFKLVIFIGWAIISLLEIYKQLIYSLDVVDNNPVWDYQWYAFPFQFCSTPLYILPFIVFLKEGKIKDALMAYMATFSLFAGVAVFFYPNDVFISTIGINIQTMIHHGLQIVFGIFIMVYNRKKFNVKFWLKGVPVFAVLVIVALILNISVYHILNGAGIYETFNMFYIGPYYDCTLPILSVIYTIIPYVCFLLLYILGFVLVSFIVYLIESGIYNLALKLKNNK